MAACERKRKIPAATATNKKPKQAAIKSQLGLEARGAVDELESEPSKRAPNAGDADDSGAEDEVA